MSQLGGTQRPAGLTPSTPTDIAFEDFSTVMKRWNAAETPLLGMAAIGEPIASDQGYSWDVDQYLTPKGAVGVSDRTPLGTGEFVNNTANIRKMMNIGQASRRAYGVGWITSSIMKLPQGAQNFTKAAKDNLLILKQEIEGSIGSEDQVASTDDGTNGSITAGIGALTNPANTYAGTAVTLGKVPEKYKLPDAQNITGKTLNDLNYELLSDLLLSMRRTTKRKSTYTLVCGLTLRQQLTLKLVRPMATASAAAALQTWQFTQNIRDQELGANITRVSSEFGEIDIIDSDWLGKTCVDVNGATTDTRADRVIYPMEKHGYLFMRDDLMLRWGVKPETAPYADNGAGDYEQVRTYWGLQLPHPQGWARLFFDDVAAA